MITLYERDGHANILVNDLSVGHMIQANQHVIVHNGEGMVLDPGGHKVYAKLFAMIADQFKIGNLRHVFFSHQDPDVIAATNGWLMVTDADAYLSALWMRFIPHFGVDEIVVERIKPIPDEGMTLELGGLTLSVLPAHFLHSPGNFQLYDPQSKILYSGDLGASVGIEYAMVEDFDAHIPAMEGFHRRYMASGKAMRAWAHMARQLDIEMIAPQHGAMFPTRELSQRFIDWAENLACGVDLLNEQGYRIPV